MIFHESKRETSALWIRFSGIEERRDKLTAHEIVNDRIDGRVEVAQPVRDQSRRYGQVGLGDTHRVPAPVDR